MGRGGGSSAQRGHQLRRNLVSPPVFQLLELRRTCDCAAAATVAVAAATVAVAADQGGNSAISGPE